MIKLPEFAARFFSGSGVRPFAAAPAQTVDFLPQPEGRVAAAFQARDLPLVVGQMRPDFHSFLDRIDAQRPSTRVSIYQDECPAAVFAGSKPPATIDTKLRWQGADALSPYLLSLRAGLLAVTHDVMRWDRQQFGQAGSVSLSAHQEIVSDRIGSHTGIAGQWHRDVIEYPAAAPHRLYLLRSRVATELLANRDTEPFPGKSFAQGLGNWQAQRHEGAVVLINGGEKGTVHRAQRPSPASGDQSSFFASIFITP